MSSNMIELLLALLYAMAIIERADLSTTSTSPTTNVTQSPLCSEDPIMLNISSDLPVRSLTKIDIQCTRPYNVLTFYLAEEVPNRDYTIMATTSGPTFQNNVIPKTFKQGKEFQILMMSRSDDGKTQLTPIRIQIVEINDRPIIDNISRSLEEGIGPVYFNYTIPIRVSDPDSGQSNGWGNITVTSPNLPEQLKIDMCPEYCLRIVKPFDADIYSQSLREQPMLFTLPEWDSAFPKGLERNEFMNGVTVGDQRPSNRILIEGPPIVKFTLIATDGGNLSASAMVTITIRDINDNSPVCRSPGTIYASPRYNIEMNMVLDLLPLCFDADNTQQNRITENGYRLLGPQTCPNVFRVQGRRLDADVRYLSPGVKICKVSVVALDYNFATEMSVDVIFGRCLASFDETGRYWNATDPGNVAFAECPEGYSGTVKRYCDRSATFHEPVYNCVKVAIINLYNKILFTKTPITEVFQELSNETISDNDPLLKGDIETVVKILDTVKSRTDIEGWNATDIAESYMDVVNNLIYETNTKSWKSLISQNQYGAEAVLKEVDSFTERLIQENNTEKSEYNKSNLYLKVGTSVNCTEGVLFPNRKSATLPDWARNTHDQIEVQCGGGEYSTFSSTIYRNISGIMPSRVTENGSTTTDIGKQVNSPVISLTLFPQSKQVLRSPAIITLEVFDRQLEKPVCSYWKFGENLGQGSWATDGCNLQSYDRHTGLVVCKCDHLTNFAILMSPTSKINPGDQIALSIISVVGCVISCICLVVTVALHAVFYRVLKSERTTILLNLCVTLFLAYIVFLVGVNRIENKVACTLISVLLHFLYLTVFFLMLAEGVDLGYRAFSKTTKYPIGRYFTIGAYVAAIVVVGISAGATQFKGYGNDKSCWLSVESGLIWAFIVPALLVILVNVVIAICVLRQMFGLSAIQQKSSIEKAKAGIRGILVMLPVMGFSWIFGVFSVSQSSMIFQYLFALFNSLQGALLFVFHCALNKKIQESLRSAKARYLSQDSDTGLTNKSTGKKTETSKI